MKLCNETAWMVAKRHTNKIHNENKVIVKLQRYNTGISNLMMFCPKVSLCLNYDWSTANVLIITGQQQNFNKMPTNFLKRIFSADSKPTASFCPASRQV